ncbi:MAG TPA: hypothetical protein VK466_07595 [Terriglobales bacterium]|nr:hypothetical protein [Terriglobales bacterium]
MHKILVISTLLLVVVLATPVWAQGTNDVYQVSPWFWLQDLNLKVQDFVAVLIVNPGEQGTPISANHGAVCADIYLFDRNQEMLECCQCRLTANALLVLKFGISLDNNPLTGFPAPQAGVLKIISDNQANCDATSPVPTPNLRAWLDNEAFAPTGVIVGLNNRVRSMEQFAQVPLQADELAFLGQACSFVQFLGSGKGVCTCPTSD